MIAYAIISMTVMDNNIAFLASDVGRLFRKRFDIAARDLGVTGPQWRALGRIAGNPAITQVALASLLEVEPITTGRMVDRLEKLGLVERRPAPSDRRVWQLFVTEQAAPVIEALRQRAIVVTEDAVDDLSEAEHAQLVALLGRVRQRLLQPCGEAVEVAAHG